MLRTINHANMANFDSQTSAGVEGYSDVQFEQLSPDEQEVHLDELEAKLREQRDSSQGRAREQKQRDLEGVQEYREKAKERAGKVQDAKEKNTVTYGRGTIRPVAAPIGLFGLRTAEFVGDKLVNTPQRGLSGLFKRLEQKGSDMIKKNAPWVKGIPIIGPWLLKKAEKSLAEREEEEKKKRKKDDEKKKKTGKAKTKLDTALAEAGDDPKKKAKAWEEYNKDIAEIAVGEKAGKKGGSGDSAPAPKSKPAAPAPSPDKK